MMANWVSALSEGSEEVAAALGEAGYIAEFHDINLDQPIKAKMENLIKMTGRFNAKEQDIEDKLWAQEEASRSQEVDGLQVACPFFVFLSGDLSPS